MWISVETPVTTRHISTDSGSIRIAIWASTPTVFA